MDEGPQRDATFLRTSGSSTDPISRSSAFGGGVRPSAPAALPARVGAYCPRPDRSYPHQPAAVPSAAGSTRHVTLLVVRRTPSAVPQCDAVSHRSSLKS